MIQLKLIQQRVFDTNKSGLLKRCILIEKVSYGATNYYACAMYNTQENRIWCLLKGLGFVVK